MSEPKRYKRLDGEYTGMGVDSLGKWIKHEDHVARVSELRGDVRRMCNAIVQYQKAHANSLNGKCSEGSLSSVRCDLFESIEAEKPSDCGRCDGSGYVYPDNNPYEDLTPCPECRCGKCHEVLFKDKDGERFCGNADCKSFAGDQPAPMEPAP